ncbi:lysozyme [bacterium JGI 053]|nr:lysozyme [bacterium JGI 053]
MAYARTTLASLVLLPAAAMAAGVQPWRDSPESMPIAAAVANAPAAAARPSSDAVGDLRPARGIDVSHYQGRIDWQAVEAEGIGFAYMKATEGATFTDPTFRRNWAAAGETRIVRGAYHRFRASRDGAAQASHFLAVVSLRGGDLPPVLDVESTDGVSDARLVRGVRAWLAEVERRTGKRPIVYTKPGFRRAHLGRSLDDYPLWIAEYGVDSPSVDPWHFWQHSERGRVAGIDRAVDLDSFNGSPAELRSLAAGRATEGAVAAR